MLTTAANTVINALATVGVRATIDARALCTPGAFITVTKLSRCTLTGSWLAHGEITLVVPDHGGRHDLTALDAILTPTLDALHTADIDTPEVTTNEQATPPSGGKLPAATVRYTLYV